MGYRRLSFSTGTVCLGLLASSVPAAADYRIEASLGITHGDHDATFSESAESFGLAINSDSTVNGSGPAATIGIWVDGLFFENFSLGLESLQLENRADLVLAAQGPDQSVAVDADFELDISAIMANAAYRRNSGAIHPYAALGIGGARVAGEVDSTVTSGAPISETGSVGFSDSDYAPAAQLVVGLDYDMTEKIYVGASARYFTIDTRLFGRDEVIRELAATVKLGVSF